MSYELFNLLPDSMTWAEKTNICHMINVQWGIAARQFNWQEFCAIPPEPEKPLLPGRCKLCGAEYKPTSYKHGLVLQIDPNGVWCHYPTCPPKQKPLWKCPDCGFTFADQQAPCGMKWSPKQEVEGLGEILGGHRSGISHNTTKRRIVEAVTTILSTRRHYQDAIQAVEAWAK